MTVENTKPAETSVSTKVLSLSPLPSNG